MEGQIAYDWHYVVHDVLFTFADIVIKVIVVVKCDTSIPHEIVFPNNLISQIGLNVYFNQGDQSFNIAGIK